jgi:regulator of sigma D
MPPFQKQGIQKINNERRRRHACSNISEAISAGFNNVYDTVVSSFSRPK